jgi:hypothetical protein
MYQEIPYPGYGEFPYRRMVEKRFAMNVKALTRNGLAPEGEFAGAGFDFRVRLPSCLA